MNYIFIINVAGFVLALVIFSSRIERRLTRIETDVNWIKKYINKGQCSNESTGKEG